MVGCGRTDDGGLPVDAGDERHVHQWLLHHLALIQVESHLCRQVAGALQPLNLQQQEARCQPGCVLLLTAG
jgi:hypothetical protein